MLVGCSLLEGVFGSFMCERLVWALGDLCC